MTVWIFHKFYENFHTNFMANLRSSAGLLGYAVMLLFQYILSIPASFLNLVYLLV